MKKIQTNRDPAEILDERIDKIQRSREWKQGFWELVLSAAVVYLVFAYVIGFAWVKGDSMAPALQEKEILLFYRLDSGYHAGDVIIFRKDGQVEYVKRVIAVEGDEVDFEKESGQLLINGDALEESYIYTQTHPTSDKVQFPLTVGKDQVFVLGDNREESLDSREFGCVDVSDITGRVILHFGQMF